MSKEKEKMLLQIIDYGRVAAGVYLSLQSVSAMVVFSKRNNQIQFSA
jgi:hypothetical protein